ncbi:MAG: thioredoxin family protein [Bacteroidales bacterium]
MKKNLGILSLLILFTSVDGFNQTRSIQFIDKPWAEILTIAKHEKKLIFLDAFTSWCGPCKWMAAKIFTNDTIADYYNSTFICAHFDMEKGEGPNLAKLYNVRAYPTLLFVSANGDMIHQRVGAPQKVQDYIQMGMVAMIPGDGFASCEKEYLDGNRAPAFILKYLDRLQGAYLPINEPMNQYFALLKEADMYSQANWEILYKYVNDLDSKEFKFLLSHHKVYEKMYTRDSVFGKVVGVYTQALITLSRNRSFNDTNLNQIKQKIKDPGYTDADKVFFQGELNMYQMKSETEKYLNLAMKEVDQNYSDDYAMLNRMAVNFFKMATEKTQIEKAAGWAKKSIALKSTTENNDTYAKLMFKLGKKADAIKFEKKAIEMAKKDNADTSKMEETLRKFQK